MSVDISYNPEKPVPSETWLNLPEQQRLILVATYHASNRLKSGRAKAHAAIHVIVENQAAMGFGPTVRAIERLQSQGLSRHDAVHAVGSVLAAHISSVIRGPSQKDAAASQSQINAELERLDAQTWRKDFGE